MVDRGSARRSSSFVPEAQRLHVLAHDSLVDVLRQHVRWVIAAWNLRKSEVLLAKSVLDPQVGSGQVPDLPQSPSSRDSNRSCGICHDRHLYIDAEVCSQGL